jgi:NAD(P)-dependent dehydrogenase (short-subunit alcohol dehydrogenase family)
VPTTIITGGTGGIGLETARRLLAADRDRELALVDLRAGAAPEELSPYGRAPVAARAGIAHMGPVPAR